MSLKEIHDLGLINLYTEIYVRDFDLGLVAYGYYFENSILNYSLNKLKSFTWQDNNNLYIDLM